MAEPAPAEPEPPLAFFSPALAENALLGSFGRDDWRRFARYLSRASYPAGERVVEETSEGREMFFIVEGEARLRRGHVDLGTIGPGAHFGELALIARHLRAATVVSVTPLVAAASPASATTRSARRIRRSPCASPRPSWARWGRASPR